VKPSELLRESLGKQPAHMPKPPPDHDPLNEV